MPTSTFFVIHESKLITGRLLVLFSVYCDVEKHVITLALTSGSQIKKRLILRG